MMIVVIVVHLTQASKTAPTTRARDGQLVGVLPDLATRNFMIISSEFHHNHNNFVRISNWSTLTKGITTTQSSHILTCARNGQLVGVLPDLAELLLAFTM